MRGTGPPATDSPTPDRSPRGSGERHGEGEQSREIAGPWARRTLHGHLTGGDGHPFESGVGFQGVSTDGHGDPVRRLLPVRRRRFRREDQVAEEMERPLGVSPRREAARPAATCPAAISPKTPSRDLRDPFTVLDPISRARARTVPTFPSSPPKKFESSSFLKSSGS